MNEIHIDRENSLTDTLYATKMNEYSARRPVLLTIAGFDPSSGAGITADLKVFAASGLYGMACITALTVQSTQGVDRVEPVAAETVRETLCKVADDVTFSGIKIGMLATGEIAEVVAELLRSLPSVPVVLDPVLRSSSGRELLDPRGLEVVKADLLARVQWITPNLDEISALTGTTVSEPRDVSIAAAKLRNAALDLGTFNLNVLVTGGHLSSPDDYLLDRDGCGHWIPGERVETNSIHGTGCALSSALLCELVAGQDGVAAARNAKEFVTSALRAAYPVGRGKGPMNHFFALDSFTRSAKR
jgi:hydroxymethylpyrimidine/phosphomethylpyrimidine kinase